MEEDIEKWRHFELHDPLEVKGKTLSEHSIPSLVMSESERSNRDVKLAEEKTQNDNKDNENNDKTEVNNYTETDEVKSGTETLLIEKKDDVVPRKEDVPEDKYIMTPGLTSKPPLPKKTTSAAPQLLTGPEKINGDPIYDYFAIKYNLDAGSQKYGETAAEKPMCEEIPEEIDETDDAGFDINDTPNELQTETRSTGKCCEIKGVSNCSFFLNKTQT